MNSDSVSAQVPDIADGVRMLGWLILGLVVGSLGAPTEDAPGMSRVQKNTFALVSTSTRPAANLHAAKVSSKAPDLLLKVTSLTVNADVSLRYARTAVVTTVRNPGNTAKEHVFGIILPETAYISGFVMTLDGKSYQAYVKYKDVAKAEFKAAVSQGISAGHVVAARNSNQFTVAVNIEPHSEALFNLTYEELLERKNGLYEMAINLHPGATVSKLEVTVHIKEPSAITVLRTGNEIDHVSGGEGHPSAKILKSEDGKEATVTFYPKIEDQNELLRIYGKKSAKKNGVLGQFVVHYDVDRPAGGEVLVNDGYFVHFFAPKHLPPINKYVVFVLDISASMKERRKMVQLKEAMTSILEELHEGDLFHIVLFGNYVKVLKLTEIAQIDQRRSNETTGAPTQTKSYSPAALATKENVDKAKKKVTKLKAHGGTDIASALLTALELIQEEEEVGWTPEEPNNADNLDDDDFDTPKLEPMIIFLTDGVPEVGEKDPKKIIDAIAKKNYGGKKAAIYSLAFGEDADRSFLHEISLNNEGFMRHIYEASDAASQIKNFYEEVSSPLLSHVKFIYPKEQIEEISLTKHQFPTYYNGSEVVVAGRVVQELGNFEPEVHGFCGVTDECKDRKFKGKPRVEMRRGDSILPLERLWAYLTIKQRLDQIDAAIATNQTAEVKAVFAEEALKLALKYSFVTPMTSMVVVKPKSTAVVDAESVDKTNPVQHYYQDYVKDPVQHQYASQDPVQHQYGSHGTVPKPSGSGQSRLVPGSLHCPEMWHLSLPLLLLPFVFQ